MAIDENNRVCLQSKRKGLGGTFETTKNIYNAMESEKTGYLVSVVYHTIMEDDKSASDQRVNMS